MQTIVESASKPKAEYREWDSSYPEAVKALVNELMPNPEYVTFEHVGSTAVIGCKRPKIHPLPIRR